MRREGTPHAQRRAVLRALAGGSLVTIAGCLDDRSGQPTLTTDRVRTEATPTASAKLTPSGGDESDNFGVSVAISEDTALIGAPWDEASTGMEAGAVYVFERESSGWTERTKLAVSEEKGDLFGWSVALAGTTAVVGAPNAAHPTRTRTDEEPHRGLATGVAYVFERANGRWSQTATLAATDGDTGDRFGWAVALEADTALVGAKQDENPNGGGAAYVFERTTSGWAQQAKVAAADGNTNDGFGWAVALGDSMALVGAPTAEDPNGSEAGAAYVFERATSGWAQQAKLAATDGDAGDKFGMAVALAGDTALIGAVGNDAPLGSTAGVAYVFERKHNRWIQTAVLNPTTVDAADAFGGTVELTGDTALVGAPSDEFNEELAGAVYVFERTTAAWVQQDTLVASDGDKLDSFGQAVALAGGTPLVGAPTDEDPDGKSAGSAYVFDL